MPVGSLLSEATTATPAALYLVAGSRAGIDAAVIERVDAATGHVTRRTVTLPFLRRLTIGPSGLYVTTSVIDKYGHHPDTILRLDPTSLHTLASRTVSDGAALDGDVELADARNTLVLTDGGGWVRTLNPETLKTLHSRRLVSRPGDLAAGFWPEQPTITATGIWVYLRQHFLRLDPTTLATRATTPSNGYIDLVPVGATLEAVGSGVARLDPNGHLTRTGALFGGQTEGDNVAATTHGLVVESDQAPPQIVEATFAGRIIGPIAAPRADQQLLAAAGNTVWIARSTDSGSSVLELRLR